VYKLYKIIFALTLCLVSVFSFSQPIVTRSGAANTVMDSRWGAIYNAYAPRYADTTAANLQIGIDTAGAYIYNYATKTFWFRQHAPKKWVEFGSGSGGSGWLLTGNAATAGASTGSFIGTTNDVSFRIRTNNTERAVFDSNGRLGLNTLAPTQRFSLAERLWMYEGGIGFENSVYIQGANGQTVSLIGGSTGGLRLIPNGYGNTSQVGVNEDADTRVYLNFISPGATEIARAGISERAFYINGIHDSTTIKFKASTNASVLIDSSRFALAKGADVVAANDLTLGFTGNLFSITGNTQINGITTFAWQPGSIIYLTFTGTPTLKNNTAGGAGTAPLLLAGRVDYTAAVGDVIAIQYDGTNFKEIARSMTGSAPNAVRYGVATEDFSYAQNRSNNGHNLYTHTIDSIDQYGIRISGDANSYFDVYDLTNAEERIYVDNKESTFMGPGSTYGMSFTLTGANLYNLEATDTTLYVVAYAGSSGLYKTTKSSIISDAYVSIAGYDDSCFIITRAGGTEDTVCFSGGELYGVGDNSYAEDRYNSGHGLYSHIIDSMLTYTVGIQGDFGSQFQVYDITTGSQRILSNPTQTNIFSPDGTNSFEVTNSGLFAYQLPATDTTIYLVGVQHVGGKLVKTLRSSITTGPGGLNTEVQYNNAGAFGGISGVTSDGTDIFIPSLYGRSTSNGDIKIEGTSDATKTSSFVQLQPTGGSVGVGTTSPSTKFQVSGTGVVSSVRNTDAGSFVAFTLQSTGGSDEGFLGYNESVGRVFLQMSSGVNFDILTNGGSNTNIRAKSDGETLVGSNTDNGSFILQVNGTTYHGGNTTMDARFLLDKGANVAAANDLTLGGDGNLFTITGSTQINAITTTSWQAGSQIAFIFTGAPLVKNNTAGGAGTATMLLSGRTDFQAAAGDYIAFQYDGTNWYETERQMAATATGTNIYNSNGTTTGVRTVTLGNNAITWNGTQASSANYAFNVANSGAGGAIGATNTGLGNAISGASTTGTGLSGSATSGIGLSGSATTGVALTLRTTIAATNSETVISRHTKGTDGTAAAGLGGYFSLQIEDDASNDQEVVRIGWVSTSVADGAETADFKISTMNAGSLSEKFRVTGNGRTIITGRLLKMQGADVASAAGAIALGLDGNSFEITGTAAITLISNLNWQNGAEVTLLFTSTATLTDGTANSGTDIGMELAGNINFTGSAGSTLTLVLSEIGGTQRWREKARSVN
jgi:hypothetical protein